VAEPISIEDALFHKAAEENFVIKSASCADFADPIHLTTQSR